MPTNFAGCPMNQRVNHCDCSSSEIALKPFHRIAEVRNQQDMTLRTLARRTGIPAEELSRQEDPYCDLTMSQLVVWQQELQVPLVNLIVDRDDVLCNSILTRARLLRTMKTVQSISDSARDSQIRRLAERACDQLVEVMPELREVSAWPKVGQRRTHSDFGRIAECPIPDSFADEICL
ncbi:MAG: hypothetical protein ACR2NU_06860 [Aeoliella sp.]